MSTRGIMGVRIDGQDKLTYNHSDSYLGGLGVDMARDIEGILANEGIDWLKQKARGIILVDQKSTPTEEQKAQLSKYANLGVSEQTTDDWYCLLRDLQGEFKATLEAGYMIDSHDFIEASLFCEWAYIVNLDEMVFEVYEGFQKKKHSKGRYAGSKPEDGYYPCALLAAFPLMEMSPAVLQAIEAFDE